MRSVTTRPSTWHLAFLSAALVCRAAAAQAPTGFVSSVNKNVSLIANSATELLHVGDYIRNLPATILTGAESQAMLFFVGGLEGSAAEFKGAIVVVLDQNTRLEVAPGPGRYSPIQFNVAEGRAKVYFDGAGHREHVWISTPLGRMRVTGSILWAQHDPAEVRSLFAVEDSTALVIHADDGRERPLLSAQKVEATAAGLFDAEPLTEADRRGWQLPDLPLISALSQRTEVRERAVARVYNVLEGRESGVVAEIAQKRALELNVPGQVASVQISSTQSNLLALAMRVTEGSFGEAAGRIAGFGGAASSGPQASRTSKLPTPVR